MLTFSSIGSNPVRNLELVAGTLTPDGFAIAGGPIATRAELNRVESLLVEVFDSAQTHFTDAPRENEYRRGIMPGAGMYVTAKWRSPLLPWRRTSRTYAWTTARRYAGEEPETLKGRAELIFLKASQDQALNPHLPGFSPPNRMAALVATDETFDDLLQKNEGVTLVGFGPTWQGDLWVHARFVLDTLAVRREGKVQVLIVHTDESTTIATRYNVDVVPTFKLFRSGEMIASHDGLCSFKDLDSLLAKYLQL